VAFTQIFKKLKWITLCLVLASLFGGCKAINQFLVKPFIKPTGDTVTLLGEAHIAPYLFTTEDTEAGCAGAEALTSFVMALGRITEEPHELAVLLHLGAGGCEEARAHEKELEYLRYIRALQPDFAEDALIAQKRHHQKAASRYLVSWQQLIAFNDDKEIGGECPELEQEFDQIVWLAGLAGGLLALNNDLMSGSYIGVPKNIAAQAERAAGCLDNKKWFGVPLALKAAVWSLLPGALPEGENEWLRLEQADVIGEKARVRLPHVFHAIAAYAKGDDERVRAVLRRHAEQIEEYPSNAQFRLFDKTATDVLLRLSDKMWTEATGKRTPLGGLGTFWDENAADDIETVDLDDLF
jgi:hypothetical protein